MDGEFNARIRTLARPFVETFLGDAHHDDIVDGFELPGELVLLWVLKNEARIIAERVADDGECKTMAELVQEMASDGSDHGMVLGQPHSLQQILGREPLL